MILFTTSGEQNVDYKGLSGEHRIFISLLHYVCMASSLTLMAM